MKRILLFVVIVLCLAFVALPAFAQDAQPSFPTVDVHSDATFIVETVLALLAGATASPLVTTVVGALKMIPALKVVPARTLTVVVAIVCYAIAALATQFGLDGQFKSGADLIVSIVPPVIAFIGTLMGAPLVYQAATKLDTPILGYQRPALPTPRNRA